MQSKIQQSPYSSIKHFPTAPYVEHATNTTRGVHATDSVDIPKYAGYALRVTPCCNATETRHKTMCQAKQELSQPSTQPASPIRNHILNKLPTPVRVDTLETYLQGCDSDRKRYLLNGFINGFSLEYTGPRNSYNCYHLKSAKDKPEVVQEKN